MIFQVLNALGSAVIFTSLFFRLVLRKISIRTHAGWSAVGSSLCLIYMFHIGEKISVAIQTVNLTLSLWFWWNSGGGDDTKRRLKDTFKKFVPTRRTAPVTS